MPSSRGPGSWLQARAYRRLIATGVQDKNGSLYGHRAVVVIVGRRGRQQRTVVHHRIRHLFLHLAA
jgi:hypothetical protein